ncbi:MAG: hypothetical protein BAJALOKI3v1_50124 [Promethearchaeota archaeon]|nr:MAG: hypothetical protein BAJALOKI3v1_50124 [Candidatus Lokiarchaeota archaeon]
MSKVISISNHNLINPSEDLSGTGWGSNNATVSDNQSSDPWGGNSADLISRTGSYPSAYYEIDPFNGPSDTYTASVYCKQASEGDSAFITIRDVTTSSNIAKATFTFSTESISLDTGDSCGYEEKIDGWYRIYVTDAGITNGNQLRVQMGPEDSGSSDVYMIGAQLEYGSIMTNYQKTPPTSAHTINSRSNHNILTYTDQFDNADWNQINASVDSDSILDPWGKLRGNKITAIGTSFPRAEYRWSNFPYNTGWYTFSVYTKQGNDDKADIVIRDNTVGGGHRAQGEFTFATESFSLITGDGGGYESVPNNWYRLYITADDVTNNNDTSVRVRVDSNSVSDYTYYTASQFEPEDTATYYQRNPYDSSPNLVSISNHNILPYSESLDDWDSKIDINVTPNDTNDPWGNNVATKIESTSTGTPRLVEQDWYSSPYFIYPSGPYIYSFYTKTDDSTTCRGLVYRAGGSNFCDFTFTFATKSFSLSIGDEGGYEEEDDGWFRLWIKDELTTGDQLNVQIQPNDVIGQSMWVTAAQLEYGEKLTPYQKTI